MSLEARAQEPPPEEPPPDGEGEVAPGFDEETPKRPKKKKKLETDEPEPDLPPLATEPGVNERLVEDINATRGEITLGELVDEILADVVAELARFSKKKVSPIAIRQISLGANVAEPYGRKLRNHIIAQIHAGTEHEIVRCVECDATRTRVEGGQWIITKGLVTTEEMKAVGEAIGAKSFLDVTFGFEPEQGMVEMDFQLVRAEDAAILWADTFRADETTPILLRSSTAPMKRKDRLEELERLLEGRPYYGIHASAGFMLIPYSGQNGDIAAVTAGFRVYERFGYERRIMFGLDLMGLLNTARPIAGGILSAGAWWIVFRPDFLTPEIRIGGKGGAFIAGSQGNAGVFQLGAESLLRYRFGVYLYALFMTKSAYIAQNESGDLGGVGVSTGLSFNW
jgi:hypothetical protein